MSLADSRQQTPLPPITPQTQRAEATLIALWSRVVQAHTFPAEWSPALGVIAGRYPHAKQDKKARWTGRDLEAFAGDWVHRAECQALYHSSAYMRADHITPAAAVALRALVIMLKWRVGAGVEGGASETACASHHRHLVNLLARSELAEVVG